MKLGMIGLGRMGTRNYCRLRIHPQVTIAAGVNVPSIDHDATTEVEMVASHEHQRDEIEPYERVLGDAMMGGATLFAR